MPAALPSLYLSRRRERRVRGGHPWVFSNEIDTARSPLKDIAPGQGVNVRAHSGRLIGSGYANPHSLICVRLLSRATDVELDRALLASRVARARALRDRLFDAPYYRLVHGEADGLPGLVVDRYGSLLCVQLSSAGMDRSRDDVLQVLREALEPDVIVLRNDLASRALEGLESYIEVAHGTLPSQTFVEENGARFSFSATEGQKTGWYYDQRRNRRAASVYARGARVLDLFSYLGGFGIRAALHGARRVTCVDASKPALERLEENARLNGVSSVVGVRAGDAFEVLRELRDEGQRFDLVILDPPAFIPRKKDVESGEAAYRRINALALGLVEAGGFVISASCSAHLGRDRLREILHGAARDARAELRIVEQGRQAPDHPLHPMMPESEYLKAYFAHVTGAD